MGLELKAFQTKVARRIFLLFILCAIVPVTALAVVSYIHVRGQLLAQAQMRLRQESKGVAVSLYERLWLMRAELRMVASSIPSGSKQSLPNTPENILDSLRERFTAAVLIREARGMTPLVGSIQGPPVFSVAEKRHLRDGKAVLSRLRAPGSTARLFMSVLFDAEGPDEGILMAEIRGAYLWEAVEGLPPGAQACVLDPANHILYTSMAEPFYDPERVFQGITFAHAGYFEWDQGEKSYFSSYWTLFLAPNFHYPEWIIVVSESEDLVFAAMSNFKKAFPVIGVLSLGMVFFLSFHLVRKSTVPIEILRDATRKIAGGAFDHKVEISSGDELEGLAASFNDMSEKIREGQALLVKAAKLSAMGQMAASIIHEINQPLTAISGLIELSLLDKLSDESREMLETTMMAVGQLNGILTRFKSFSRMSAEANQSVSLNEVLDQVLRLLEHQFLMRRVHCHVRQGENLPAIAGDPQALQQVFSNLLLNASDALEGKSDGERAIRVETRAEDGKVIVEVEDNGCGIPEDIRKMIFDPFFTTKSPEKGTGLGMAIIESILDKHHASIQLESEVGIGTKFTLTFPAASPPGKTVPSAELQTTGKDNP